MSTPHRRETDARAFHRVLRAFVDAAAEAVDGSPSDITKAICAAAVDVEPMIPLRDVFSAALRLRAEGLVWFADTMDAGGVTPAGLTLLAEADRVMVS